MVDVAMTVAYLLQMAPGKTGNPLHELVGVVFVALFVVHHMLNRGWLRRLGRQRSLQARTMLVSDVLLTVCVAGVAVTGVLMSRFAVPGLAVPAVAHVVRPLHGACAYAGLMVVSLHVGLHVRAIRGYMGVRAGETSPWVNRALLAATAVLGTWAFLHLGVAGKLSGRPSFPDGMTPLALQLVWHVALAMPFVVAGALFGETMRKRGNSSTAKEGEGTQS